MVGQVIWHYTDFVGMAGILADGQLRLSNTRGMNDKKEMLAIMLDLEQALLERLPERQEKIREMFDLQLKKREKESVYGSSFSYLRNDAAQWERYGLGGRGVSLGFRADILEKIIKPYMLEPVSYIRESRMADYIEPLVEMIEKKNTKLSMDAIDAIFRKMWARSGAYKDYSFKSECEVRVMTLPVSINSPLVGTSEIKVSDDNAYCPINYEITANKIREFMLLHLKKRCRMSGYDYEELITDVIIGPKATQNVVIIENFLAQHGLKKLAGRVIKSDCPLI